MNLEDQMESLCNNLAVSLISFKSTVLGLRYDSVDDRGVCRRELCQMINERVCAVAVWRWEIVFSNVTINREVVMIFDLKDSFDELVLPA